MLPSTSVAEEVKERDPPRGIVLSSAVKVTTGEVLPIRQAPSTQDVPEIQDASIV